MKHNVLKGFVMKFKKCLVVLLMTLMANAFGMNVNVHDLNCTVELQEYKYDFYLKKDDEKIGRACVILGKEKITATLYDLEIYNSDLRNKGVGSHLFKVVVNFLYCMGVTRVHIRVMPLGFEGMSDKEIEQNNRRLQKFYEKLGCNVSFSRGYIEGGFAEIDPRKYADYVTMLRKKVKRTQPRSRKNLYPKELACLFKDIKKKEKFDLSSIKCVVDKKKSHWCERMRCTFMVNNENIGEARLSSRDKGKGYLSNFTVKPEYQHMGVGQHNFKTAMQQACLFFENITEVSFQAVALDTESDSGWSSSSWGSNEWKEKCRKNERLYAFYCGLRCVLKDKTVEYAIDPRIYKDYSI